MLRHHVDDGTRIGVRAQVLGMPDSCFNLMLHSGQCMIVASCVIVLSHRHGQKNLRPCVCVLVVCFVALCVVCVWSRQFTPCFTVIPQQPPEAKARGDLELELEESKVGFACACRLFVGMHV